MQNKKMITWPDFPNLSLLMNWNFLTESGKWSWINILWQFLMQETLTNIISGGGGGWNNSVILILFTFCYIVIFWIDFIYLF